ncbi:MAG: tRNA pseudouridine(38-40) synthase TruA [Candidatus Gastranaerophilaceae bacterium]
MQRFVLVIQYKGTNFSGSQTQQKRKDFETDLEGGVRTVQGELEKAIRTLTKERIKTVFSGRTDAGVHAREQFVHLDSEFNFEHEGIIGSLNGLLPKDISVSRIFRVGNDFHVQRSAKSRFYRYKIVNRLQRSAFDEDCLYVRKPLNIDYINRVLGFLAGEHDFTSFKKTNTENPAKICRVSDVRCHREGDEVYIDITADRFLYGMVRAIVGTVLYMERKGLPEAQIAAILEAKDRREAGPAVSPFGLTLMKVNYTQ